MKSIVLTCAFVYLCLFAFSQSSPSARVEQARTAAELGAMSESERATLEFRAEKLCWFEQIKDESQQQWYTLTDLNGNAVVLTDAMVADFNPLLYALPQQAVRCENLPVQTNTGNRYILIVRSQEMMQKEWQRRQTKISKNRNK